jgi:transcriptional regulator with XRE-family HTH domain
VRALREKAGYTQDELVKLCEKQGYPVHVTTISKVELGRNRPRPGLFAALVAALGVHPDDLLDRDAA